MISKLSRSPHAGSVEVTKCKYRLSIGARERRSLYLAGFGLPPLMSGSLRQRASRPINVP
jgi:hypothetical protein